MTNFDQIKRALTECEKELLEERAAIMEYHGGLTRREAEDKAAEMHRKGQDQLFK